MCRKVSQLLLVLATAIIAAGSYPAWAVLEVDVQPSCGGSGFTGTAQEGAVTVSFMSCPSENACHTKIWSDASGLATGRVTH